MKEKTEFEKKHWEQALTEIPDGTELISIEPTTHRVEMLGIFYKRPNEKGNQYLSAMTPNGRFQAELLQGQQSIIEEVRLPVIPPTNRN